MYVSSLLKIENGSRKIGWHGIEKGEVDFYTSMDQNGSPTRGRGVHEWTSSKLWVHARQVVQGSVKGASNKVEKVACKGICRHCLILK